MIHVTCDFEGANPHDAGDVERLAERRFVVRPWSENGDANYKFSLLVGVRNTARRAVEAEFAVDWADPEYNACRDYVLLGRNDQWRYFPAVIDGPVATARVVVPPGRWQLALHPTYGLDRLDKWRRRAEEAPALRVRELGPSSGGRAITAFDVGDADAPPQRRLAVLGRFHPYETAGSFAADGALRRLLTDARAGRLAGRLVSVLPIANVDGVATGACKRTGPGGPDMSHNARTTDDAGVAALLAWLAELRPGLMLDIHGWMYHYQDGLNWTDDAMVDGFRRRAAASADLDRAWKGHGLTDPAGSDSLSGIIKEASATDSLIFSFGWYGRSVRHMRRIGVAATLAAMDMQ